jgi:chromosomal replication initiator protein
MKRMTRRAVCAGLVAVPAAALLPEAVSARDVVETASSLVPEAVQGDIIDRIVAVVARHDGVTAELMRSPERTWVAVNARRKAMYLSYRMSKTSLPEIGRRMGGRDHTTVLHAVRVFDARAQTDTAFAAELKSLALEADAGAEGLLAASAGRLRKPAA